MRWCALNISVPDGWYKYFIVREACTEVKGATYINALLQRPSGENGTSDYVG